MEPALAHALEVLKSEGIQALGTTSHTFDTGGFTLLIGLAESHISVHTWPELGKLQMDVFLCNYFRENEDRCRRIFDAIVAYFDPTDLDRTEVWRT
ncbi:MAG TPA: S-adenosylmethionine decarboxylase [Dermatophilaceae bacterium]